MQGNVSRRLLALFRDETVSFILKRAALWKS